MGSRLSDVIADDETIRQTTAAGSDGRAFSRLAYSQQSRWLSMTNGFALSL
jgi:hypothetical protein